MYRLKDRFGSHSALWFRTHGFTDGIGLMPVKSGRRRLGGHVVSCSGEARFAVAGQPGACADRTLPPIDHCDHRSSDVPSHTPSHIRRTRHAQNHQARRASSQFRLYNCAQTYYGCEQGHRESGEVSEEHEASKGCKARDSE